MKCCKGLLFFLFIVLIIPCLVDAEIRRLVIDDFSGGINQAAPSLVKPNQCYDMVNFDITPNGALSPRRGFDYVDLASDSTSGTSIEGLIPYGFIGNKHLLFQRTGNYNYIQMFTNGTDGIVHDTFTVNGVDYIVNSADTILLFMSSPAYVRTHRVDSINAHPTLSIRVTAADSGDKGVFVTLDSIYQDSSFSVGSDVGGNPYANYNWTQLGQDLMQYTSVRSGTEDSVLSQYNAVINSSRPQTGVHSFQWSGKSWVTSYGSEMRVFDGENMYPARPLGPGQLQAVAIDNSGHSTTLTGKQIRYKYMGPAQCTSPDVWDNMSMPSFPVDVYRGAVFLKGLPIAGDCAQERDHRLLRSIDGGDYKLLTWPANGDMFLDTLPADSAGDTATYPYGNRQRGTSGIAGSATPGDPYRPPGALFVDTNSITNTADTAWHYGIDYKDSITTGLDNHIVRYSVVFVNNLGRRSYMAPPYDAIWRHNSLTWQHTVELTYIPVASDTFEIDKRILLRSFAKSCDTKCPDADGGLAPEGCFDPGNWYILDTLFNDSLTTYSDSMPACSINVPSRLYCEGWEPIVTTLAEHYQYTTGDNPEDDCLDSVIGFKPTMIIQKGAQAFAIGDPEHPNRIYMSTFYDPGLYLTPSTWPLDKYIEVPGNGDDWFIALAILNNNLYAFRQNSIVKISGFTFYQLQLQTISQRVGAIAPRSVAATKTHIYFADNSGVYVTSGGPPMKISDQIDSIWLDLETKMFEGGGGAGLGDARRYCIGEVVGDEYWLQTLTSDYGTLIFSEKNGSWRRSDVVYQRIIKYSTDTLELDYQQGNILIVHGGDSIFSPTTTELDDWDTTGHTYIYRSRELFEGPAREKIHYVDIHGRGQLDSILLVSYREGREVVDSATIIGVKWGKRNSSTGSIRQRIAVDEILPSYSFDMVLYPTVISGNNTIGWGITSIVVGWQPWDEGRPR